MNKYKSNSEEEIKQLKLDLMISGNSPSLSNNSTTNITDKNNTKNGQMEKFASNLGYFLYEQFGSENNYIYNIQTYREIKFGQEVKTVSLDFPQFIMINSVPYLFTMKEDDSLLISSGNMRNNNKASIIDKRMNASVYFGNIELTISQAKNIDIYGAFKISNFNLDSFNRNEIEVIYNGIKNKDKSPFEYMVIEAACNITNMKDMIDKIKKDKSIIEKMIPKRVLYCIITNNKKVDNPVIDFNCDYIIIRIIGSTFFGKDASKCYDFEIRKEVRCIKTQLEGLKSRVGSLETRIGSLETRVGSLETRVGSLETRVGSIETRVGSMENVLKLLVKEVNSLNVKLTQFMEKK